MIADTGHAALWMAAALSLVWLASRERSVVIAQAVMAAVSVVALIGSTPGIPLILAAALFAVALVALHPSRVSLLLTAGGAALLIIGVACDRLFVVQTMTIAKPGERLHVGPWLVEFATINPTAGPEFTALEAELRATRGRGVSLLMPQSQTMIAPLGVRSRPAVATFWDGRLSASLAAAANDGRRLRLQWQPFLPLVWLGGMLMALGGLIVLISALLRIWRRRPAPRGRYE
ncbi:MAG: cytochrome c-type biogenesis CcmF C-terminal domain-containing protein [Sphingomicrobium sp.]